jgi:hypothetical protein
MTKIKAESKMFCNLQNLNQKGRTNENQPNKCG